MKKLLVLFITVLSVCAMFAFGCKADNSANGGSNDDIIQQNAEQECPDGECPDEDCPDGKCPDDADDEKRLPPPELLPRMPDKRHRDAPFRPEPRPIPSPRHRK